MATEQTPAETARTLTRAQRRDLLAAVEMHRQHPTWSIPSTQTAKGLLLAGCFVSPVSDFPRSNVMITTHGFATAEALSVSS